MLLAKIIIAEFQNSSKVLSIHKTLGILKQGTNVLIRNQKLFMKISFLTSLMITFILQYHLIWTLTDKELIALSTIFLISLVTLEA